MLLSILLEEAEEKFVLHNNNPVVLLVVFDVYVIVGCPCRRLSLSSSLENIVRDGNKDVWSQVATTTLKMMT